MAKSLQDAYKIASENHDLDYFKDLLATWQAETEAFNKAEAEAQDEYERQQAEIAAAEGEAGGEAATEKPKKKPARKSKGADDSILDEVDAAPKSNKKRKKVDTESDDAPKVCLTQSVLPSRLLTHIHYQGQKDTQGYEAEWAQNTERCIRPEG